MVFDSFCVEASLLIANQLRGLIIMTRRKFTAVLAILLIFACVLSLAACKQNNNAKKNTTPAEEVEEPEPEPIVNPLTGSFDFDEKAANRRICGFVVENHPAARPQIGMDDKKYSPDIILEGEVEGGISRMLWLYADYHKLPDTIGPLRSARPPYIRFANMFDAYFIHWGMSHTEGGYIGANTIFKRYNIDHINAMDFPDKSDAFGRDTSTGKSLEHTGRAYGKNIPAAIKEAGFRTTPKERNKLKWREENGTVGKKTCGEVTLKFSNIAGTTHWVYDKEKNVYRTDSFQNNTERDNLIILADKTKYVTNAVYQGHGVTYCDYLYKGGTAWVISNGTYCKLRWKRDGQNFVLYKVKKTKVPKTEEEKAAEQSENSAKDEMEDPDYKIETEEVEYELNRGKSYIGWISSNNGGSVDIKIIKTDEEDA